MSDPRQRLEEIERRIAAACDRSGRDRGAVCLVGAGKRQPPELLRRTFEAGLRVFGENRVQEAEAKKPELPAEAEWHLIGPLQSNKTRSAAELFDVVHSLDRLKIIRHLDRHAGDLGRTIPCFVQVLLGGEDTKHGFVPDRLEEALEALGACDHLEPLGLMAIPPPGDNPEASRPWFRRLRELGERARELWPGDWPGRLSMGMSGDFEVAIEEGATHVRIGTALFGTRPET
jgi:PLP dependent protein